MEITKKIRFISIKSRTAFVFISRCKHLSKFYIRFRYKLNQSKSLINLKLFQQINDSINLFFNAKKKINNFQIFIAALPEFFFF